MTTATHTAATVVRAAMDHARELGSPVLGQEHVLLALGGHPDSLGGRLFSAIGVDPSAIRNGLLGMITPRGAAGDPVPTPRFQKALEEAEAEASQHGRPTTSADLVLGILRSHAGVGFQLLGYAGIKEGDARTALERVLAGHPELDEPADTPVASIFG